MSKTTSFEKNVISFIDRIINENKLQLSQKCNSSFLSFKKDIQFGINSSKSNLSYSEEFRLNQILIQINNGKCTRQCQRDEQCFLFIENNTLNTGYLVSITACLACDLNNFYTKKYYINSIITNLTQSNPPFYRSKKLETLNYILGIYIFTSFISTVIINSKCKYSNNQLIKCFDIISNFTKLKTKSEITFSKVHFINSIRVISLFFLLILHSIDPVYSSLKMYFYADYFSFVKKSSVLTSLSLISILTSINLTLTTAIFTIIWLPHLSKSNGKMSFCSFLIVKFIKTKSALLTMTLLVRSLPNYATGGRSIFIFIQRITVARIVNWFRKLPNSPVRPISTPLDLYAYTVLFYFVKYLYKMDKICHSFANLVVIATMVTHGIFNICVHDKIHLTWPITFDDEKFRSTILFLLINIIGAFFGFFLVKYPLKSSPSTMNLVKKVSITLLPLSLFFQFFIHRQDEKENYPTTFILTISFHSINCLSISGLLVVAFNDSKSYINKLSSHKFFLPITRIFYSMLLVHPFISDFFVNLDSKMNLKINFPTKQIISMSFIVPAGLLMHIFIEAPFYNVTNFIMYHGFEKKSYSPSNSLV